MTALSSDCRKKLILMVMAVILLTATSAFATVWMEQQISRSAQRSQELESEYAETVRKLRYLDERIATLHQPAILQGRVAGTMRPSLGSQLVVVDRSQLPGGAAYASARREPFEVSVDLAFIDMNLKP